MNTESMNQHAKKEYEERSKYLDKIRGCMFGGAIGDALGYTVEFSGEQEIFSKYGAAGITEYELHHHTGKALISDDTQMSLFTANGLLFGDTRGKLRGIRAEPRHYVVKAYQDWLRTQEMSYSQWINKEKIFMENISWLSYVPELFSRRAPGNTCISALTARQDKTILDSFIANPLNNSKGCGGIMRTAPITLRYQSEDRSVIDLEAAEISAITHGHSLGYMPSAVLAHIINRIVYPDELLSLKEIIHDAEKAVIELFKEDPQLPDLTRMIDLAVELSENNDTDLNNIHRIGEGWVAEETLGIAIYCALRHQDDFSAGIIAAVNHKGDSDSTGAVTGNILGAIHGYNAIDVKWKENLELSDIILEISDDLCYGCPMNEYDDCDDPEWTRKYINCGLSKQEMDDYLLHFFSSDQK